MVDYLPDLLDYLFLHYYFLFSGTVSEVADFFVSLA